MSIHPVFACSKCKVNNKDTRTTPKVKISSNLTTKTPERRCRSGDFIVNFKHILHLILVFLLLSLSR